MMLPSPSAISGDCGQASASSSCLIAAFATEGERSEERFPLRFEAETECNISGDHFVLVLVCIICIVDLRAWIQARAGRL